MHLEKLEILGFKSFGKRTSFAFNSGVTGIVGPNGCGKSNIVDAIRWVLGEQKAGILRSERMENVIFNGTKTLKPLGMAEVALTIKNTKNVLPVEYTDVVITRRLFRSGESQYLLNNSICRLKDILDLFMDTGMGPDAYSVIELRMVESILDGKPEDRRRIFEQAAGVSKFKQRRRIAFRKLDDTESDLIRVEDIISEVQKNVDSLKRQVRRAQRYEELTERLKTSEIRHATMQYSKLINELEPQQANHTLIQKDLDKLSARLHLHESEVETFRTQLIQLEQKLSSAQVKLDTANKTIYKKEEEIAICRERFNATSERIAKNEIEIKELNVKCVQLDASKVETAELMNRLQKEISEVEKEYAVQKEQLDEYEKNLEQKHLTLRKIENQHLQLIDNISEKMKQNERLHFQIEHLTERIKEVTAETGSLGEQKIQSEKLFVELEQKILVLTDEFERKAIEHEEVDSKISLMLEEAEALKETIFRDKNRIEDLGNKANLLKRLVESYDEYPEGVQNLMQQRKSDGFPGTLADVISVPEKYQAALEAYLGEATAYVLSNDISLAFEGIDYLKANEKGIVTCLPVAHFSNSKPQTIDSGIKNSIPGFIGVGNELVTCEERFRPIVNSILNNCVVVEDIQPIRQAYGSHRNGEFSFVSLSGELIFNWGGVKGGRKSGKNEGLIGRKDQLDQVESEQDTLIDSLEKNETSRERLVAEIERLTSHRKALVEQQKSIENEKSEIQLELRQKRFEYNTYIGQLDKNMAEIKTHEIQLKEAQQSIERMKPEIDHAKAEKSRLKQEIEAIQGEIDKLSTETASFASKVHALKLNVVEKRGEHTNAEQEQNRNVMLVKEYSHSIEVRTRENVEGIEQKDKLQSKIKELDQELETDFNSQERLENIVQSHEAERSELARKIDEVNRVIRGLRFDREKISEKVHSTELKISELKLKAENIQQKIKEEYGQQITREQIAEDDAEQTLEEEIEAVKSKLQALGPINLLALKEFKKEKERLDFLLSQQTDLTTAKENLLETIGVINKTARTKFFDVFKLVRNNFSIVFKGFFPEGEADLILAEGEDVLEADIEVVANPKGRRLGSLSLLSGGEKTLTAISLLFSIYLVKPSPFCILDEVDAPLDDSNIERFINAIRRFADNTQFIIVTHNKLTMKAADCLYGITMPQDGVSKVVSVKIENE
ncbi:chromosome segregation protein SMC [candidate division KSB1 bacterium]|nr:chromosome segregation protein SMC [candidate division KSB1 bacterium]